MLTDKLSWERHRNAHPAYPVLWVPWSDGSCSKAQEVGVQHLCQVTERSSSILIIFSYREQIFDGEQPSYLKASQKLTNELQQ